MIYQSQELKQDIISMLKTKSVYIPNTAGTKHTTRCPYCGDSHNESHGHFTILIDVESDTPMLYKCLKCDIKGLLTDSVLEELGFYVSSDMHSLLKSFNKKISKIYKLINMEFESYSVPLYLKTYANQSKLDYINNRLDTDINMEEAKDLKLVLNLFDFMKFNNIESLQGMAFKQLKTLNESYVGFLSNNNNCITFRNITDNDRLMRYFKVILNPKNINQNTFYSIPNSIDLMYTHDINIRIAEGTFDILSVFKNLVKNKNNEYYFASCGFGSNVIIRYLIHNGINTGLNLHIYSDNDKTDDDHRKYLFKNSSVSYWLDHIDIHRNQFNNEKDYGIPTNRIIDSRYRIK
jgi:DNA-directed RNA polymerase subunit RPC12/RpoP